VLLFSLKVFGQSLANGLPLFFDNDMPGLVFFDLLLGARGKQLFLFQKVKAVEVDRPLLGVAVDEPLAGFTPDLALEPVDLLLHTADGGSVFVQLLMIRISFRCEVLVRLEL